MMGDFLEELRGTLYGKKNLQAVFGKEEGSELCELAIRLRGERPSSAPDFIEWMLMDAGRGMGFEEVKRKWSAKLKEVG